MKKYFIYQDNKSDKFWSVEVEDNALIVVFGRIGTGGTMKIKEFASKAEAQKELGKLVAQKLKKGYKEALEKDYEIDEPSEPSVFDLLCDYIKADTLTKAKLNKLLNENDESDFVEAFEQDGNDCLWALACRLQRYNAIKLILEWASDNAIHTYTPYLFAYESKNFPLLLLLIENAALVYKVQSPRSNAVQYCDPASKVFPEIIESIKGRIKSDEELQKYPELIELVDTARYINLAMDMSGGNADDHIDCTIVEIGKKTKHRLEYFEVNNWSHAMTYLFLNWKSEDQEKIILNLGNDDIKCTLDRYIGFGTLAIELAIQHLPFEVVLKFFALLLSRKMQVFKWNWHEHKLFQLLDEKYLDTSKPSPLRLPIGTLKAFATH